VAGSGRAARAARRLGIPERKTVRSQGEEFVQLVREYAQQETLDPLRGLGRFVTFGVIGSVVLTVGLALLLLGLLRVLQTETGSTFTGHLTWVPYLITAVVALGVLGLAAWRISAGPARRGERPDAATTRRSS
jgi:predicted cobalt transporter CbtA